MPILALIANMSLPMLIGAGIVIVFFSVFFLTFMRYVHLWLQCFMTRANITFPNLVFMSVRKVDPRVIVKSKIMAVQSGIAHEQKIATRDLESMAQTAEFLANPATKVLHTTRRDSNAV